MIPDIIWGNEPDIDWREALANDEELDDDDELEKTPEDVLQGLGFDPLDEKVDFEEKESGKIQNANLIEAHPDDSQATSLRNAIAAEIDAINLYEKIAEQTDNEDLRKLLLSIADEEKVHIGEFESLLQEIDQAQKEDLEKGGKEAGRIENAEGDHWITTKKGEEGKGRHVLIDKDGKIIGGSLPKAAQGKHIGSWWKEEKKPEPALHQHLQSVGVPYAHHESGHLTTGHGVEYGKNKWGKDEIKSGHVRAQTSKHTKDYLALESNFSDKDMIKAMGAKFGPQLGNQYPKQWYLPHGKLARLIKSMEHSEVTPKAIEAYGEWAETHPDAVAKIKETIGAIPMKTKSAETPSPKSEEKKPAAKETKPYSYKDAQAAYEEKIKAGTAGLHSGSGYRSTGWSPGEVVRAPKNMVEKGSPEFLYVTKASKQYFREEGLSFGVGDESGYAYSADTRPATEEEAAPVKAKIKEREEAKAKAAKLIDLTRNLHKESGAEWPEGHDNVPEGEKINIGKGQTIYGGGEWFVIGKDYIWYVRNNGADGDDWSRNNVRTGGAGAVGVRVPYSKGLESEIRDLTGGKVQNQFMNAAIDSIRSEE